MSQKLDEDLCLPSEPIRFHTDTLASRQDLTTLLRGRAHHPRKHPKTYGLLSASGGGKDQAGVGKGMDELTAHHTERDGHEGRRRR